MLIPEIFIGLFLGYLIGKSDANYSKEMRNLFGFLFLGLIIVFILGAIFISAKWVIEYISPNPNYRLLLDGFSCLVFLFTFSLVTIRNSKKYGLYSSSKAMCFNFEKLDLMKKIYLFYFFVFKLFLITFLIFFLFGSLIEFIFSISRVTAGRFFFISFFASYTIILTGMLPSFLFRTSNLFFRYILNSFDMEPQNEDSRVIDLACKAYFKQGSNFENPIRVSLLNKKTDEKFVLASLLEILKSYIEGNQFEDSAYIKVCAQDLELRLKEVYQKL
jgi:hypothetical protein